MPPKTNAVQQPLYLVAARQQMPHYDTNNFSCFAIFPDYASAENHARETMVEMVNSSWRGGICACLPHVKEKVLKGQSLSSENVHLLTRDVLFELWCEEDDCRPDSCPVRVSVIKMNPTPHRPVVGGTAAATAVAYHHVCKTKRPVLFSLPGRNLKRHAPQRRARSNSDDEDGDDAEAEEEDDEEEEEEEQPEDEEEDESDTAEVRVPKPGKNTFAL